MSDENRPIIVEQSRTPTGIFEHFRAHPSCRKSGGLGYARRKTTVWFCSEHREDGIGQVEGQYRGLWPW
jgi:hypothetical protein